MLAQNVFGDEVRARPELVEEFGAALLVAPAPAERRDVVRERVEPDVDGVQRVVRDGDGPAHGSFQAADRQVLKAGANEAHDFIASRLGADEVGTTLVKLKQRVAEVGEAEEVALGTRPEGVWGRAAARFLSGGSMLSVELGAGGQNQPS